MRRDYSVPVMSRSTKEQIPAFRGDRLVQALRSHLMTHVELAREMETSERNVSRWCNGKVEPRYPNVRRMAAVLGRDPHWFYERDDTLQEAA